MEAALTFNTKNLDDDQDYFMVTATREEWELIVKNLDGIGHNFVTISLLRELEGWGITK